MIAVPIQEDAIEIAISRRLLKPEDRSNGYWVLNACYAAQLSTAALSWLTRENVITYKQCGDGLGSDTGQISGASSAAFRIYAWIWTAR